MLVDIQLQCNQTRQVKLINFNLYNLNRLETNPNSIVYALDRDKTAIDLAHQLKLKYP